jgi:hypothetical protein
MLVSVSVVGSVAAGDIDERIDENMEATNTYEDVYEPFESGPPTNSLILLPDPYGDWLNHPFQPLRNDPGFDGRAVYALHDHTFEAVREFDDRRAYRYVYRGGWAPFAGSPEDARLQRVRDVTGDGVQLRTAVGIPDGGTAVTARIATDEGSRYYVAPNVSDSLGLNLTVEGEQVRASGDFRPVANDSLAVDGRDDVRLTMFVEYGASGGFEYRFDLPVEVTDEGVRALTPRIERCRNARACGGAAAYIPETAPDGVFVRSELVVHEPNS